MSYKKGDLVELSDGKTAILISNTYVHRKLDAEDHEMIANGMGEYAGTYCSAFNVLIPETGVEKRIICGTHNFKKIADAEVEV